MTSERYMALDPETFDALIEAVRRFVAERLRPLEAQVEDEDAVPEAIVAEMRGLGLFGLSIAEAYGGLGLTKIGRASCRERVCQCVDLGGRRTLKKKKRTRQNTTK